MLVNRVRWPPAGVPGGARWRKLCRARGRKLGDEDANWERDNKPAGAFMITKRSLIDPYLDE